ncbi:hypothetical protein J6590_093939 [Homalodisca vitripennis]|nr:hypothetical protein J6590_093939 [Homalodisca vitripennis]
MSMSDPCRTSDIREILFQTDVSDFVDSEVEAVPSTSRARPSQEDDVQSLGGMLSDSDSQLTDFLSGSDDNYESDSSDLETSDRKIRARSRPRASDESSDNAEHLVRPEIPIMPNISRPTLG